MSFSGRNGVRLQINKYIRVLHVKKILRKYSIRPAQNCAFPKKKASFDFFPASFTLETAIVLPLFLCAVLTILSLALLFLTEIKVQDALMQTAEELSWSVPALQDDTDKQRDYLENYTVARMLLFLKDSAISHPVISNGALGIDYDNSTYSAKREEIHLVAEYKVVLPIALFGKRTYEVRQEAVTRAWVGNQTGEADRGDNDYVYVTDYGKVYHITRECTYLKREIKHIAFGHLANVRNAYGGIYKPCQQCINDVPIKKYESSVLYITVHGGRYHLDKNCSTLKRYIKKINKKDVGNKSCCSACGGGK